jgi:hypothetical protein
MNHGIPEDRVLQCTPDLPEPTPEEARNGWTAVTLAAYRRERDLAANHPNRISVADHYEIARLPIDTVPRTGPRNARNGPTGRA